MLGVASNDSSDAPAPLADSNGDNRQHSSSADKQLVVLSVTAQ